MLHTGWQKWNSTFFKIFLRGVSSSANVKGLSWANRVKETAGAICLVSLPKDGDGARGGVGGYLVTSHSKPRQNCAFQGFIWRHHSSCWQWRCMVLSDFQKVTPEISRAFCLAVKLWGGRLVECMWKAWIDLRLWGDLNPCPVKVVWEDGGSLTSGTRGHKRGDRMFWLICLFVWPC